MASIKHSLEKELPKIITEGYRQACYYFQIIPIKKVLFKGFFSPKVYQEIIDNEEILANLGIATWQKRAFKLALQKLGLVKSGWAFPANRESWIIFNPLYCHIKYSPEAVMELAELIAHEVAHAIIFNVDIWRGHNFPHEEITKYLRDYYLQNCDWEKIFNN